MTMYKPSPIFVDLPAMRRFARASTGSQAIGDTLVRRAVKAYNETSQANGDPAFSARVCHFRHLHDALAASHHRSVQNLGTISDQKIVEERVRSLSPMKRRALLLSSLEGFGDAEIAKIMRADAKQVKHWLAEARAEIDRQHACRILIIEDEPIIALDLEGIVGKLGHQVVGIARTRQQAVGIARSNAPDIVLADIELAEETSGIDAVNEILEDLDIPAVFVTGFPERLLTSTKKEPVYLVSKPFNDHILRITLAQALATNTSSRAVA